MFLRKPKGCRAAPKEHLRFIADVAIDEPEDEDLTDSVIIVRQNVETALNPQDEDNSECLFKGINDVNTVNKHTELVEQEIPIQEDTWSTIDGETVSKRVHAPFCQKATMLYPVTESIETSHRMSECSIGSLGEILVGSPSSQEARHVLVHGFQGKFGAEKLVSDMDPQTDDLAMLQYLMKKPTCFIIFGKPGVADFKLAEKMTEFWGSVHIDVLTEINQELSQRPSSEWSMNAQLKVTEAKPVSVDMVLQLIHKRLATPEVKHRGYVLTGFPLVGPGYNSDVCNQFENLETFVMKPDVILYVMCPDEDVVYFRSKMRCNAKTGEEINSLVAAPRTQVLFSIGRDPRFQPIEDNWKESTLEKSKLNEASQNVVTKITHMEPFVREELKFFNAHAMPPINHFILGYDQQFVIRVDGRTSADHMIKVVKSHLEVVTGLTRTYLVEKLIDPNRNKNNNPFVSDADLPEALPEMESFEGETAEDSYSRLSGYGIAGPRFRWRWSQFHTKCPVAMHYRSIIPGSPYFACRFLDKVYFMSTEVAMNAFIANPRPYLMPSLPPCVVGISGLGLSLKSTVASTLEAYFNVPVISYEIELEKTTRVKHDGIIEEARRDAVIDAIDDINIPNLEEYEEKMIDRETKIEDWIDGNQSLLQEFIDNGTSDDEFILKQLNSTFPHLENKNDAEELLNNKVLFMKHLPLSLIAFIEEPIHVDENHPLVIAAGVEAAKEAAKLHISLTPSEISNMLCERIASIKDQVKHLPDEFGVRHEELIIDGLPIDKEVIKLLEESGNLPFQIICLQTDERPYEDFLASWKAKQQLLNLKKDLVAEDGQQTPAEDDTQDPTEEDTQNPTVEDTQNPNPTEEDTQNPTEGDMQNPTEGDMQNPTEGDMQNPTEGDMHNPTEEDTQNPTEEDTQDLTEDDMQYPSEKEYFENVEEFKHQWRGLLSRESLLPEIHQINVVGKDIDSVTQDAIAVVNGLASYRAHLMTFAEKQEEQRISRMEYEASQGPVGEGMDSPRPPRSLFHNARLGCTGFYCPVHLKLRNSLHKGNENRACIYRDKVYLTSNVEAEKAFLKRPIDFVEGVLPCPPPPRIFVIGAIGTGKSTLTSELRKTYAMTHVDFLAKFERINMPRRKFGRKHDCYPSESNGEHDMYERVKMTEQEKVIRSYLLFGGGVPDQLVENVFNNFWDVDPIHTQGVIIEGFPARHTDIQFMRKHKLFPDVVIVMKADEFTCVTRMHAQYMSLWKEKQKVEVAKKRYHDNLLWKEYEESKRALFDTLMEEYHMELKAIEEADAEEEEIFTSIVDEDLEEALPPQDSHKNVFGPSERTAEGRLEKALEEERVAAQEKEDEERRAIKALEAEERQRQKVLQEREMYIQTVEENMQIVEDEIPEPVSYFILETFEEAELRIMGELRRFYAVDLDNLDAIIELLQEEHIPIIELNSTAKSPSMLCLQAQQPLAAYCVKPDSPRCGLFERIYTITYEMVKELLETGYFFLSKFGKWCPVEVYEKKYSILRYLPQMNRRKCIPVTYGSYVYFLSTKENFEKFAYNPAFYTQKKISLPLVKPNIAIVGPVLSGKTTVAHRLNMHLGLKVISIKSALLYAVEFLGASKLAKQSKEVLEKGCKVPLQLGMLAVEAAMIDPQAAAQGCIFDGFPNSQDEVIELSNLGIVLSQIFHIDLSQPEIDVRAQLAIESFFGDYHGPPFSRDHILVRHCNYVTNVIPMVQVWLPLEYQNVHAVNALRSLDGLVKDIEDFIHDNVKGVRQYLEDIEHGVPACMAVMCVTPYEFFARQSQYKHRCPVCWIDSKLIKTANFPPDRTQVYQYQNHYYFVCLLHIYKFVADPEKYVKYEKHIYLEVQPEGVVSFADSTLYANGYCTFTFRNTGGYHQKGLRSLALKYLDHVYLFASKDAQLKFMERPMDYFQQKMSFCADIPFDSILPDDLPILGYLEQRISEALKTVTNLVGTTRPLRPGLSPEVMAAIFCGMCIKMANKNSSAETKERARIQLEKLFGESLKLQSAIKRFGYGLKHAINMRPKLMEVFNAKQKSFVEEIVID